MKRFICVFLAICILCALAACARDDSGRQDAATAAVTHEYDPESDGVAGELAVIFYAKGEDTAGHDLSAWDRELITSHEDKSAPATAEIELMGKTFEGKYAYSAVFYPATHLSHYYRADFGGFAINAETGAIDSFSASYAETDDRLDAEHCRSRADAVAATFVDLTQYTVEQTENEDAYFFTYTKYVEGLPTSDCLGVGISVFGGGITSLGTSLAGSFEVTAETERDVRRLRHADLDAAIRAKVDARFTGEYEMSYGDFTVMRLPDGTLALMTKVETSRQEKDVADGETYFYPHTSAYDAYIVEK